MISINKIEKNNELYIAVLDVRSDIDFTVNAEIEFDGDLIVSVEFDVFSVMVWDGDLDVSAKKARNMINKNNMIQFVMDNAQEVISDG